MKTSLPLLIEWTPGDVRLVDPATGRTARGATIAECAPERGREAVVAVGRRSAFVRSLAVPPGSRGDVARVVELGLLASLPLEPREVVFGYRLGGNGRLAVVGAMRAETLVRLYAEGQAAGLRVRAVVPAAFGSWLAMRERALPRGAVVGFDAGVLSVDVVEGGELVYSRAAPAGLGDADDEIARTFATADVPPATVLALASPELPADLHDPKEALLRLADLRAIERDLFNLELPAKREARLARAQRWRVRRALLAAGIALGTSGYAYTVRVRAAKPVLLPKELTASLAHAREDRALAQGRVDRAGRENRVLDVAFGPAQSAADVVAALANGAPPDAWVTSLSVARGAPVGVSGFALHGKDVGSFSDALAKNPRFRRMQVVSTSVATVGKTPVVQFLLSGDAVGAAPFDRPLRRTRKPVKAQPANR